MGSRRDHTRPLAFPRLGGRSSRREATEENPAGGPVIDGGASQHRENRVATAVIVVQRGILQAEEKYLVHPSATLGTWFARVQETIAVASRVTLGRIEESRGLSEDEIADEQLGVHADICAEAIRAAAQVWGGGPSPLAREEILDLVSSRRPPDPRLCWMTFLLSLAHCNAALEPIANGLREMDLPMGAPTDCEAVAQSFIAVGSHSFGALYALC